MENGQRWSIRKIGKRVVARDVAKALGYSLNQISGPIARYCGNRTKDLDVVTNQQVTVIDLDDVITFVSRARTGISAEEKADLITYVRNLLMY